MFVMSAYFLVKKYSVSSHHMNKVVALVGLALLLLDTVVSTSQETSESIILTNLLAMRASHCNCSQAVCQQRSKSSECG